MQKELPMRKKHLLLLMFVLFLMMTGCNGSGESKAISNDEIMSPITINACSLITKEKLSVIMGVTFKPGETVVENVSPKGNYVSQCGYWAESGNKGVSILLRNDSSIPKDISEILKYSPEEDADLKAAADDAISKSIKVDEIGDYAVWYSFLEAATFSFTYKGEYIAHIYFYDFGFNGDTMEKAKLVAAEILMKLS